VSVRQVAQTFGTNSSLLEIRRQFTENLINTLKGGASELVNADLNEESANLLSLQTRQQLGTISLSIAQQSEQSVLRLF
jgi:flagellin